MLGLTVFATDGLTVAAGRNEADKIASRPRGERPSALLCGNDLVALGVLQGLMAHSIRVPDDAAIVGTTTSSSRRPPCL